MRRHKHAAIVLMGFALMLFVVGSSSALAQPPQPSQPPAQAERAKAPAPIEGDIVSVDADAKKLVVKPAAGPNVEFLYTDSTEVTGATGGAAGLATMKEGRVTVHFTENAAAKTKTATRIIVQPAK